MSQAAAAAASSAVGGDVRHHLGQHNGGSTSGMPGHHTNQQMSQQDTLPPDLGESTYTFVHRDQERLRTFTQISILTKTIEEMQRTRRFVLSVEYRNECHILSVACLLSYALKFPINALINLSATPRW